MQIILNGLPMPPTSNLQYMIARGRFVPNGSLTRYKKDFKEWACRNHHIIAEAQKEQLKDVALSISCKFYFSKGRVYTTGPKAKSKLQKLDVTNRVKSLHDLICEFLEIDDRQFFDVQLSKHELEGKSLEYCNVEITEATTHARLNSQT